MTSKTPEPDFARHDHTHGLTPELFRSLGPGQRKREKLDAIYERPDGSTVHFRGFEPLGADDMRVLQGLVALSTVRSRRLSPEPKTDIGTFLREQMEFRFDAVHDDAIVVDASFRKIAAAIGNANVDDARNIRTCIERLAAVDILVDDGSGRRRQFRLLSNYRSNMAGGTVSVALNPLLAAALGDRFMLIDMAEVRALEGDVASVLHQALCARVDPGKRQSFFIDTMCKWVWGEPSSNRETNKSRRRDLKTALLELRDIGWEVGMSPPRAVIPIWIGRPTLEGASLFWGRKKPRNPKKTKETPPASE